MAGQTTDFLRELAQLLPERRIFAPGKTRKMFQLVRQSLRPTVRQFGDQLDFAERQVERLADLADGRSQSIRGEGADEPRVFGAIARVHTADQLLTDLAREIEIDVGHRSERLVQEPAKEELVGDRIDVGQAEEITDDR